MTTTTSRTSGTTGICRKNLRKTIDFKDFDQDAFFNIMNILLLNSKKNIKVILHDFNNLNEVINNVSKFKATR